MSTWPIKGVLLGSLALLGACGDPDIASLERELEALRADPGELTLPPLPEVPSYQAVSYDQADRRSPFMAELPEAEELPVGTTDLAPDQDRAKEPLEAYALESLDLVGTLSVGGRPSALVRDPDGEVHRLRSGNHLGTDYGRIIGITDASVLLVEVVSNGQGGWIERTRLLTLEEQMDRAG